MLVFVVKLLAKQKKSIIIVVVVSLRKRRPTKSALYESVWMRPTIPEKNTEIDEFDCRGDEGEHMADRGRSVGVAKEGGKWRENETD